MARPLPLVAPPCSSRASPSARRARAPWAAPAPQAAAAACGTVPAGDLRVRAESYEQVAKGHLEARGLVDMCLGTMRVQADKADVFEDAQPDGSIKRRLVAEGNVVFIRGEERLAGERMEMD